MHNQEIVSYLHIKSSLAPPPQEMLVRRLPMEYNGK